MAGTQQGRESQDNPVAVNVVAMVDVIFCLCIFFMCSFHFRQIEGRIDSHLPKDRASAPGPAVVVNEIRVIMRWDPGSSTTLRTVKGREYARSDEELAAALLAAREDYGREGRPGAPIIIDAEKDVPWEEVVRVMDLCRQHRLDPIEFGGPARDIEPPPSPQASAAAAPSP